jgi:hypothetical protein
MTRKHIKRALWYMMLFLPSRRRLDISCLSSSHLVTLTLTCSDIQMSSDDHAPRRVIDCFHLLDSDSRDMDRLPLSDCTHVAFTKECFDTLGTRTYGRLAEWISNSDIVYFILDGINLATPALDVWFWDKMARARRFGASPSPTQQSQMTGKIITICIQ